MDRTSARLALLQVAILTLSACAQKHPSAVVPSAYQPTASIQEIMQSEIDPAAGALWDSVAIVSTTSGTEEHRPRTDEDWLAVRHHAITLVEATNLLVMPGRRVAAKNKPLEDAHVPGILDAPHIQQAIDRDPASFVDRAHALHAAALEALNAIDARDPKALMNAGAQIDSACERCHLHYWYPEEQQPKTSSAR